VTPSLRRLRSGLLGVSGLRVPSAVAESVARHND